MASEAELSCEVLDDMGKRERLKERRKEILFSWSFHGGRVNSEISLLRVLNRRKKRDVGDEGAREGRSNPKKMRKRDWSRRAMKLSSTKASSPIIRSVLQIAVTRPRVIRDGDVGDHERGNYYRESIP